MVHLARTVLLAHETLKTDWTVQAYGRERL